MTYLDYWLEGLWEFSHFTNAIETVQRMTNIYEIFIVCIIVVLLLFYKRSYLLNLYYINIYIINCNYHFTTWNMKKIEFLIIEITKSKKVG
jgi:hypothetical protein